MSLTIPIIVQAARRPADDHDIVVEDDGEDVSSDDSSDDEMTGIEVIEPIQMNLNEQGLDLVPDTGSGLFFTWNAIYRRRSWSTEYLCRAIDWLRIWRTKYLRRTECSIVGCR